MSISSVRISYLVWGLLLLLAGGGEGAVCACAYHKDKSYVGNMPPEGTFEEEMK